jgi:hypothetical protein
MLSTALPAARLFTGQAPGSAAAPYAVLSGRGRQLLVRTSSGTAIERALLRITSWTTTLAAGRQLSQAIAARFDRSDFDLDEGRVLNMERLNEEATQNDDGAWRIDFDYAITLRRSAGSPAT